MNRVVIKRDGLEKNFDITCIEEAIKKAAIAASKEINDFDDIISKITNKLNKEKMTVEEIQEVIEHTLMVSKYKDVAKKFIEYRHERDLARNKKSSLFQAINGIIEQNNPLILKENANLDSKTLTTQRTLMAGELSKYLAKDVLSKDVYEAHMDGDIHFHDMNFSPILPYVNCCLVDLTNMLEGGFTLGSAHIGSPKGIGVATAVTAQIIAQVSSANYGGTTIANIDQVLAKYVKMSYEKHLAKGIKYKIPDVITYAKELTEKETYDAFQALEYEINSLFNSHSQSPFTTVSFGMGTSWEERLIQQSILKVRLEGLGEDKVTAIFPKLLFLIDDGLNFKQGDPNYDIKQLALECSAKRLYPDIISVKNNKLITGSSVPVASMGKL